MPLPNLVTIPSPLEFFTYWYSTAEVVEAPMPACDCANVWAPHSPMQLVWKS